MKPSIKGAGALCAALLMSGALFCTPLLAADSTSAAGESSVGTENAGQAPESVGMSGASLSGGEGLTGFYVSARIPQNQTNTGLSYFSLLMEPRQEQVLEVEVVNEGDEEITVDIGAVSASTNPNGIIDYRTPGIQDDTLEIPFADLAEVVEESIRVPAGGTGVAQVRVTMPEEEFEGAVLGGLVFTKRPPETDLDETVDGALIQNVYHYAVGVVLREQPQDVLPDFELVEVLPNLFDNQPSFIHAIRNTEPFIVKQMEVTASVYRGEQATGNPVATRSQKLVDMAPNSVLEFAAQPEDGTLEGGTYTSEVVLRLEEREWRFTNSFVVQNDEATLVNDLAPFIQPQTAPASSNLVLILIIAALALLVLILILLLFTRRRRREGND